MPDLLKTGAEWLEDQRHAELSHAIEYTKGVTVYQINATVGRTQFETVDDNGVLWKSEARDYLIKSANLEGDMPEAGDVITETIDGTTYYYEVAAFGAQPVFIFDDQNMRTMRIHTKRIVSP